MHRFILPPYAAQRPCRCKVLANLPLLFLLIVFVASWVQAQSLIKGQVLDALDQSPLEGVSVYFDGTSIGTITNEAGFFELPLAQKINATLVVSYLGYETRSIADLQNLSKGFTAKILLEEAVVSLDEVVLEPDTWSRERKYRLFKRAFLGEDNAAQRTKILNPEVLRFYYNKQTAKLYADASAPLDIQNKYLGYLVRYALIDFELSFFKDTVQNEWPQEYISYYAGTSFFTPLDLQTKSKYGKNRAKAYHGSTLFFMRTLLLGQLKEKGFRFFYGQKEVPWEVVFSLNQEEDFLKVIQEIPRITILHNKKQSVLEAMNGPFYLDGLGNFAPPTAYLLAAIWGLNA
ncbi:MAG: carboxypeptidase-like regulatory domain-containing protein [Bacteroidetes bacterium]|nr:carboxypeptidase-like regulatory domain-containing protein [Bacteroidota bacterium]